MEGGDQEPERSLIAMPRRGTRRMLLNTCNCCFLINAPHLFGARFEFRRGDGSNERTREGFMS